MLAEHEIARSSWSRRTSSASFHPEPRGRDRSPRVRAGEGVTCRAIRSGRRSNARRARPTPSAATSSRSCPGRRGRSRRRERGRQGEHDARVGGRQGPELFGAGRQHQRAIKRGSGDLEGGARTRRSRTRATGRRRGDVRRDADRQPEPNHPRRPARSRNSGGNLGENGSTAWMFSRKGSIQVEKDAAPDERLLEIALEAGAEDLNDSRAPGDHERPGIVRRRPRRIEAAGIPMPLSLLDDAPEHGAGGGRSGQAGARPARGARGARRRSERLRELRHPRIGDGRARLAPRMAGSHAGERLDRIGSTTARDPGGPGRLPHIPSSV